MTRTNKKQYIPPIIEYEELDNECYFLTTSRNEGWAKDGIFEDEVKQYNDSNFLDID